MKFLEDKDIGLIAAILGIIFVLSLVIGFGFWCFTQIAEASDFKIPIFKTQMSASIPLWYKATTTKDTLKIETNASHILINDRFFK